MLRSQKDITAYGKDERLLEDAAKLTQVKSTAEADGILWEDLTDEQKKSLYRDYTGEELRNLSDVERAEALIDAPGPEGRQMGDIYQAAHPLEFAGQLAKAYVGNKKRKEAVSKQEALSKQKAQAMELAGGLGAGNVMQQRAHELELAKAQNPITPPGGGGPPPGGGGPPPGAGGPPPGAGGPPPQQPQMPTPGQTPGQNVNAAMAMNMQGTPQILGPAPPGGYKSQMPPQGQAQIGETEFMKRFKLEEMMRLMRGQ